MMPKPELFIFVFRALVALPVYELRASSIMLADALTDLRAQV